MALNIWIQRQLPMTFEFRKVTAFRSILDRRILKGNINQVVHLSLLLLFLLVQGCSTLPFYSNDEPKSYVNLGTVDWAPEPHFYSETSLPTKKPSDNALPNGTSFREEELAPERNNYLEH